MADKIPTNIVVPRGPDFADPTLMLAFDRDLNRQLTDYLQTIATKLNASDLTDGGEVTGPFTVVGDVDITGDLNVTGTGTFSGTLNSGSIVSTGSILASNGAVRAQGAVNGMVFDDRGGGGDLWQWYATSGIARLWYSTGSDHLRMNPSGSLDLMYGQLNFPATANPSADVHTLDDYEEGTWTPTIAFAGASVGITYGTRVAKYTKIGRIVNVDVDITLTAKGSSTGIATIEGLPFTVVGAPPPSGSVGFYSAFTGLVGVPIVLGSVTGMQLRQFGAATVASVTDANFTNTSRIIASMTYTA